MKLTPKDVELFKSISKSQFGRDLADYCDRVMNDICDSRNWGKDETKESAVQAAKAIKMYFKDKVASTKQSAQLLVNESE